MFWLEVRRLTWEHCHLNLTTTVHLTSHPWKLQSLPEVHTPDTLYLEMMFSTMVFSSGVSTDTRSMHIDLQMFRASSQLVCSDIS